MLVTFLFPRRLDGFLPSSLLQAAMLLYVYVYVLVSGELCFAVRLNFKGKVLLGFQENWVLLTADYSQIELRLMAHFSKDTSLIELLSNPHGDAFTLIASRWTGKPENEVKTQEREHTKRLVYGILYGMGANSLSEQMNCSADEAKAKIRSFKSSFPGVASWLHEAVAFCHERGCVQVSLLPSGIRFLV